MAILQIVTGILPPDPALRAALDLMPISVYVANPRGQIEFVNRRLCEVTGASPQELLGEAWTALLHPDDRERVLETFHAGLVAGKESTVRYRFRIRDGSYQWVFSRTTPFVDARGKIVRWFGTSIDIDRLVRAEEAAAQREAALRASEQHYRALGESVSQIVWTADANGAIDWYNRRWYEYTGQTSDEALGWGWQSVHHPEDFPSVMERWPRSIASGEPFEIESRLRSGDGQYRWFLTRIQPSRDEHGRLIRWYGTCTDVDEQRLAFERSKHVAQTLHDVFLPRSLPQRKDVRFSRASIPAQSEWMVGGDWSDVVELTSGRIVITIGDVSGHEMEASVTASRLRQTLLVSVLDNEDPAAILRKMNQVLRFQEATAVATCLVGILDTGARTFTYASAGHPPPILATPFEAAKLLAYGDLPLGVADSPEFVNHQVALARPGAVLVFYTDGVTESRRDIDAAERKLLTMTDVVATEGEFIASADALLNAALAGAVPRDDAVVLVAHVERAGDKPVSRDHVWRFHSGDALTARRSRHAVTAFLRRIAADDRQLFDAEVIIGELLANTVEHAPGFVSVRIDCGGAEPVVTVRDSGPGRIPRSGRLRDDIFGEDGRGLYLIRKLARKVRVRAVTGGTEIAVTLPFVCKDVEKNAEA